MPVPNKRYKACRGFSGAKVVTRHYIWCKLISIRSAIPNDFIVCREAEQRQKNVLHAVIEMVETV